MTYVKYTSPVLACVVLNIASETSVSAPCVSAHLLKEAFRRSHGKRHVLNDHEAHATIQDVSTLVQQDLNL